MAHPGLVWPVPAGLPITNQPSVNRSAELDELVAPAVPASSPGRLIWILGLGAFGLAYSITTVAAYLPPVLAKSTDSSTLIGLVLAAEGVFAFFIPFLVGPMSDATDSAWPPPSVHAPRARTDGGHARPGRVHAQLAPDRARTLR